MPQQLPQGESCLRSSQRRRGEEGGPLGAGKGRGCPWWSENRQGGAGVGAAGNTKAGEFE